MQKEKNQIRADDINDLFIKKMYLKKEMGQGKWKEIILYCNRNVRWEGNERDCGFIASFELE